MKNQDPLLKKKRVAPKAVGALAMDLIASTGSTILETATNPKALGTLAAAGIVLGGAKIGEAERAKNTAHDTAPTPIEIVQPSSVAEDVPIHLGNGNSLTLPPNPTVNGIHYPKNPPGNGLPLK